MLDGPGVSPPVETGESRVSRVWRSVVGYLPLAAGILAAIVATLIIHDLSSRVSHLDVCEKHPHSDSCGAFIQGRIHTCGEYPACRATLLGIVRVERHHQRQQATTTPSSSGQSGSGSGSGSDQSAGTAASSGSAGSGPAGSGGDGSGQSSPTEPVSPTITVSTPPTTTTTPPPTTTPTPPSGSPPGNGPLVQTPDHIDLPNLPQIEIPPICVRGILNCPG